jgi:IS4 transposase
VRLDLHSLLPRFVLVESAKAADSIRAAEVCAGVKSGEIVIFDRAYVRLARQLSQTATALVEVDGQEREMEFLTNNLSWSAGSVADLYRCRWQIDILKYFNEEDLRNRVQLQ